MRPTCEMGKQLGNKARGTEFRLLLVIFLRNPSRCTYSAILEPAPDAR